VELRRRWRIAPTPYSLLPIPHSLLIFDNDGVLVDTELQANTVLAALLTECGVPTSLEDSLEVYLGTSLRHVRETCLARGSGALPADFEARYHDRLFAHLGTEVQPIPGIHDLLSALSLPTCVASSGAHHRIEFTLGGAGLLDHFRGRIFSADDVARGKPAPDLFLHAAHSMGVEPASCVVVEDSPWGIQAANAAGMTSIGFAFRTPAHRLNAATGGVIPAMPDLLQWLSSRGGGAAVAIS